MDLFQQYYLVLCSCCYSLCIRNDCSTSTTQSESDASFSVLVILRELVCFCLSVCSGLIAVFILAHLGLEEARSPFKCILDRGKAGKVHDYLRLYIC